MDNSTREIIDNNEIESRASSQETGSPYPEDGNGRKKSKPRERARRRHRVINSCLECRRRKLKCDKGVGTVHPEIKTDILIKVFRRSV